MKHLRKFNETFTSSRMKFYEIRQNNSGGSWVVDENLCEFLYIEAYSEDSALGIAESLGCYWDGVEDDMDCPCCGDRWDNSADEVDLEKIKQGMEITKRLNRTSSDADAEIEKLKREYPGMVWLAEPVVELKWGSDYVTGQVRIDTISQYAQVKANMYGDTSPAARIFYANGKVEEIFSNRL